jgi:radical SAM protein with 4Fe4S-binding SPASM domain
VSSHGPLEGELDLGTWLGILDEFARNKVLYVTVSGGEPFCRTDLPTLLEAVASRPFQMRINTNATLVGRAEAHLLAGLKPRLVDVMVGIEGSTVDSHDSIRGKGAFEAMLKGVGELNRAGVRPSFYCTVSPANLGRLAAVAGLALDMGSTISFNPFVRSGPCLPQDLWLRPEQLRAAVEEAHGLAVEHPGRIGGTLIQTWGILRDIRTGAAPRRTGHGHSCAGCSRRIVVLPDGWVSPCDHFPDLRIGFLPGSSLLDILASPEARAFRRRVEAPLDAVRECSECRYLQYCPGGCPVVPWDTPGPLGPDPLGCPKALLDG